MSRSVPERCADLVAPAGEIGNFDPRADAPAHALGRIGEPPHRLGDGAGEQDRKQHHDARRRPERP